MIAVCFIYITYAALKRQSNSTSLKKKFAIK